MWLVLLGIAQVIAIIWVAALVLVARDRARGYAPPTATVSLAEALAASPPIPLWKRALAIPLAVVILPPTLLVLGVLLAPFAVVIFGAHGFFWLRLKLFGVPIPDLGPPDGPADPA